MASSDHIELFKGDLRALATAIESDFGLVVTDVASNNQGWGNQVYKAQLEGKTVFIRLNESTRIFPVEIAGYKLFKENTIPVPEIIAYKENPETIGYPTMIMSAAEGVALNTITPSKEKDALYESVGEIVKKINAISLEGFGSLTLENGMLRGKYATWKENWSSLESYYKEEISQLVEHELLTSTEIEQIQKFQTEISELNFGKASLLHRDIHGAHIFVKNQTVTGIIDLSRLLAGDPRYDIAMALMFQSDTQQQYFKKGYGELASDPLVLKYLAIIAATKTAFRTKRGLKKDAEKARDTFREVLSKI